MLNNEERKKSKMKNNSNEQYFFRSLNKFIFYFIFIHCKIIYALFIQIANYIDYIVTFISLPSYNAPYTV